MTESDIKIPEDFFLRMKGTLQRAFPDFLKSLKETSPISIRQNQHKNFSIEGEPVPWCETGRYLKTRPVFTLDPVLHAGAYYVQEASSMFLEQAIKQLGLQNKPIRVLDLCAAPGGKSTHLAGLLHEDSLLVSNEVIRARASILDENLTKWGVGNVVVTNNDPRDFDNLTGFFDVIVVDAPCSGEGLFRKDQDAMTEWSVNNVQLCAKRQQRILADVWPALKSDGILIYSTCTYNSLENEENMQWLAEQHKLESVNLTIESEWGIEAVKHKNIIGYRFYPHHVAGEGFFLSVVQKRESIEPVSLNKKVAPTSPAKKIQEQLSHWILDPDHYILHQHNDLISLFRKSVATDHLFLYRKLHIVNSGTAVASLKGDKPIPEHALALSTRLNREHFQTAELNKTDALNFLRKENIHLTGHNKGYLLVTNQNLPLGWLNVLDNRSNNLYPKTWRIRMGNSPV
jgi:16S rRNA C967 or C1407 C5-methylase (RsmB/RsmF family)/NOL1/NOP2/fmu family ribosome biogenesis protein